VEIATKFEHLVYLAMNAAHGANNIFEKSPDLCVAPSIMSRMKTFSVEMAHYSQVTRQAMFDLRYHDPQPRFEKNTSELNAYS
jgi:hypothetical protein